MQDQQPDPPKRSFLRTAASPEDLVPPVDPAHLKKAFEYCSEVHGHFPGQAVAMGVDHLFPAGTNAEAIGKRVCMLTLLLHAIRDYAAKESDTNPLAPLICHQQPDEAMFAVMARIRLERMERGFIYNDFPYNIEDFMRQVEQEAA